MKNAENSRRYTYKITPISLDNCRRVELDIKVMLQHSTLALWADTKTNLFEYSWILMKTVETNEQIAERSRSILAKLLIAHLIVALEY